MKPETLRLFSASSSTTSVSKLRLGISLAIKVLRLDMTDIFCWLCSEAPFFLLNFRTKLFGV